MSKIISYPIGKAIHRAFRIVGKYVIGDELNGEDFNVGIEILNTMLIEWANDGYVPEVVTKEKETLYSGIGEYPIDNIRDIVSIHNAIVTPLGDEKTSYSVEIIDNETFIKQYLNLSESRSPDNEDADVPSIITLDKNDGNLVVYPIPDKDYYLSFSAIRHYSSYIYSEDSIELLPNWYEAVVYGLASRLSDEFQLPINERSLLLGKEKYFKARAFSKNMMNAEKIKLNSIVGDVV